MLRDIQLSDAGAICEIYNYYVLNTHVTFEVQVVSIKEMEERISEVIQKYPWLVYEVEGKIVGYAYAGKWRARPAYRHSVECTVYLLNEFSGRGIGAILYAALISHLDQMKLHAIIGGIALPNESSIALHKKLGFEKVAHFKEVGYKFNTWIDVSYWEKIMN